MNCLYNSSTFKFVAPPDWYLNNRIVSNVASVIITFVYVYVIAVLLWQFKKLKNLPYYICLFNIGFFDVQVLIRRSFTKIPFIKDSEWSVWIYFFAVQAAMFGQLLAVLVLTVNRFFSVVFWRHYKTVITTRFAWACTTVTWVGALLGGSPFLTPLGRSVVYDCNGIAVSFRIIPSYYLVYLLAGAILPLFEIILYFIIVFFIFRQRKQSSNNNQDSDNKVLTKIIYQCIIITMAQVNVMIWALVGANTGKGGYRLKVAVEWAFLTNAGINPFLYLAFSSEIRGICVESLPLFLRKRIERMKSEMTITKVKVILITNDRKNREIAENDGIVTMSMREYVNGLGELYLHLLDKLSSLDTSSSDPEVEKVGTKRPRHQFPAHLTPAETVNAVRTGRLKQGTYQASRENYLEGFVFLTDAGAKTSVEPVLIQGLMSINRAVQGDVVAIEMLPRSEWSAPAALLKISELDTVTDLGDDITTEEDAELKAVLPATNAGGTDDEGPVVKKSRLDENGEGSRPMPKTKPQPTGKVVGIVRRNWRPYCGIIEKSTIPGASRHLFRPAERRVPRIRIETRQIDRLHGQKVIVAIDGWPRESRYPWGHLVRILGPVGDRNAENEVLLLEHDIPHHVFSDAVLQCLPKLPWIITPQDLEVRKDFRDLCICSVDPPGCTDIDDALHCRLLDEKSPDGLQMYEAGVHIADVSHFVRPHNAMDLEAADRGTTVYLVDRRIDMLPDLLSSNLCSLRGNEERFAFSVVWKVTENAQIIDVYFTKSIIRSRAAMTYADAQKAIDDPTRTDDIALGLRGLLAMSKKLKAMRHSRGALSLSSLEVRFKVDSETHDPIEVEAKQALATHSMVEEFMLLANCSVAEKIVNDFPDCALLRRHPVPPPSNFKPVIEAAAMRGFDIKVDSGEALTKSLDNAMLKDNPYLNTMLRMLTTRCMTQAVYFASGTMERPEYFHFGLASPIYTHFTSPIRRYSDLMVHRLLAASLRSGETYPDLLNRQKTEKICHNLNYRHKQAQYAGRASVLLSVHLFFKGKVEILEAYILSVRQNALQVLMPKYGLESAIMLPKDGPLKFDDKNFCVRGVDKNGGEIVLRMFDRLKVKLSLDEKDIQHQKLRVELIEPAVDGFSVEAILDFEPENANVATFSKPRLSAKQILD